MSLIKHIITNILPRYRYKLAHFIRVRIHRWVSYLRYIVAYLRIGWRKYFFKITCQPRKIIAIALIEHLGDIVATEPIARYVKQRSPTAYIIWCVSESYQDIIESNPYIDRTLVVSCLAEWIRLSNTKICDEIIDLHFQGRVCLTCKLPPAIFRGDRSITNNNYLHQGNLLAAFCKNANLPEIKETPRVYIPGSIVSHIDQLELPEHIITIHCLSNARAKEWSLAKWQILVERITHDWNYHVIEVGVTSGLHTIFQDTRNARYLNCCGKFSILETAEIIRRSTVFIGIDSGPAHLANAVETFGIILLGEYAGFSHYIPYSGRYADGTNATLLYSEGLVADIEVDTVYQKFRERIER